MLPTAGRVIMLIFWIAILLPLLLIVLAEVIFVLTIVLMMI